MLTYFPKVFSRKAIVIFVVAMTLVSVLFSRYAIGFQWMVLAAVEVVGFFAMTNQMSLRWNKVTAKKFVKRLFWLALSLRLVWVVFSYYFYIQQTGRPFEFDAADAIGYHGEAEWLAGTGWPHVMEYLFYSRNGYSDSGYPLYLTAIYKTFGPNVIFPRILKAFYSAFTCVLIYKLTSRITNENTGRLAGIFAMLMPNLIVYCGLHLKETEMLFLTTAFLERADYAIRTKTHAFANIIVAFLLAVSLFFFRTVLGAAAVFAFVTGVLFSPDVVIKKGRKVAIGFWVVLAVVVMAGGTLFNEIESYWESRDDNQKTKRIEQTMRGNQWAKYATGAVMAPMIFVLPFSTMVDTDQNNQLVAAGGNYVRNFMGAFAIIALYALFFKNKNWRNFSLVGAYTVAYLGIIALSGFANSERFLLPGLVGLLVFWAYGLSQLDRKTMKFVNIWVYVVLVMEVAWAYFKIGSRGLLG